MKPKNYLNNKDILKEIHKSKSTYSSFVDDSDDQYDIILKSINEITDETVEEAKRNRAKRLATEQFDEAKLNGQTVKASEFEIDPDTISHKELVFRVMSFDHIPEEPGRKKNPKTIADTKTKLNFPPFQHYRFDDNNEISIVGKSHWVGGMQNGHFSKDHGRATNKLADMWMKLCDRYGSRGNVRSYTYNDEMRGQAVLQLSQIGLQFDESKSNNPFAYYTTSVKNSFVRIINIEKRNQSVRDDILEIGGMKPSSTRQHSGEWDHAVKRAEKDGIAVFRQPTAEQLTKKTGK